MDPKIKSKEELYDAGFMKIDSYTIEQEMGDEVVEYKRQCMYRGHAVFVIPYDAKINSVVMVKQMRIGALINGEASTTEFPAGIIDDGEEAVETAKRELKEETGLDARSIEQIYKSIYTTVGGSDENITYFLAEVDSSKTLPTCGEYGESEYIETEVISVDELLNRALKEQSLNTAATLISTLLLKEKLEL